MSSGSGYIVNAVPGTYYVSSTIFPENNPFDGVSTIAAADAFITRFDSSGERITWLADETADWTENRALAADETGVYIILDRQANTYIRKFDPDGNLLWTFDCGVSQPEGMHLKDGYIVTSGYGYGGGVNSQQVMCIDASDGSLVWSHDTATIGYAWHGPLYNGLPTAISDVWDSEGNAQRLYWYGSTGLLGSWYLDGSYVLVPTDDPTVFYGYDTFGAVPYQIWRLDGVGLGQPVETYTGVTVPSSSAASISYDQGILYGHTPYSAGDITSWAYDMTTGAQLWTYAHTDARDYNGIFDDTRAKDGQYLQVAYDDAPPYGAYMTVFDDAGSVLLGPIRWGGTVSQWMNGAIAPGESIAIYGE